MTTLTDIYEVSAALEDGSLDVHLRALLGFRAWHMVIEHEAELGSDALLYAKDDSPHIRIFIEAYPDTDRDCMLNMAASPFERVTTGSKGRTKQVPCQSFASHLIEKEMSAA